MVYMINVTYSSILSNYTCKSENWLHLSLQYPERVYTFDSGVTSLDFSLAHPNLLAVSAYLSFTNRH